MPRDASFPGPRHPPSRQRYAASAALWESSDCGVWRLQASRYAVAARAVTRGNVKYGKAAWKDAEERLCGVRAALAARVEKYITRDELLVLTDWKMARNEARPNYALTTKCGVDEVEGKTREGLRAGGREGMRIIKELKGVGMATVSVLLWIFDGEEWAFYGEEAARAVFGGKIGYGEKDYDRFLDAMKEKAAEVELSVGEVENALFASAHWDWLVKEELVDAEGEGDADESGPKRYGKRGKDDDGGEEGDTKRAKLAT